MKESGANEVTPNTTIIINSKQRKIQLRAWSQSPVTRSSLADLAREAVARASKRLENAEEAPSRCAKDEIVDLRGEAQTYPGGRNGRASYKAR